jgi:hypothetical protein
MPTTSSVRSRPRNATPSEDKASNKPVERFHDGPVQVSIWERTGPKGLFRTASFQLRYRDQGGEWQTGQSYGLTGLSHLERAAHRARDSIEKWQQKTSTNPSNELGG